jgi:hypothetical protein
MRWVSSASCRIDLHRGLFPSLLGMVLALSALSPGIAEASAETEPEAGRPARAVATYVEGEVLLVADGGRASAVAIGSELPEDAELRLGNSARLTVFWDHGETTVLSGPAKAIDLKPSQDRPGRRSKAKGAVAVARNVWRAVCSKLARLTKGREGAPALTQEPGAALVPSLRRPAVWAISPANERVRPGRVTLRWEGHSVTGPYVAMVWDANGETVWGKSTEAETIDVPQSDGLVPGKRYWWLAVPSSEDIIRSSLFPCWFEILPAEDLGLVEGELEYARDVFEGVSPVSQLHLAVGCVLEDHGLLSEAWAEYDTAARLCPDVSVYRVLAGRETTRMHCLGWVDTEIRDASEERE